MMTRRRLLASVALFGATAMGAGLVWDTRNRPKAEAATFEISRTDAEWRELLTDNQYAVLRQAGTERAGSSPLLAEKRAGTYLCAGCDLPVYASADKYDSGTGWPSFTKAIDNAIGTKPDPQTFVTLTEVHCRRCGGHLGHIFDDGPAPLGKRHCINGLSLRFQPT